MVLVGMAIATVGVDYLSGVERFTYGVQRLGEGINFLPVAMGIFGIAEVLGAVAQREFLPAPKKIKLRELVPTREEWRRSIPAMFRGSFLGFAIGLVPGPSTVISTFASYMAEKKLSKNPNEFGHGAIEGVAGPEAANNAAVGGAYVPLFALGIPFTPAMAIVLAALMLHGLTPGPTLISTKPDLFWAVIASMYLGNVMLLVLNLPLVNLFVSILRVPQHILYPVIVVICVIGTYTVNGSVLDVLVLAIFGFIGFAVRGLGFPSAPLVLAMVIGPMLETSLRQSLNITGGSVSGIVLRPICLSLYAIVALSFIIPFMVKHVRRPPGRPAR